MASCREATPARAHRLGKAAGRWAGDDSELDVFAAERYFNGDDALWCARSSSSSFSSAFRTGTHEHGLSAATATAATSSSEASWNSRSALLPDGKVLAAAAVAAASGEAEQPGSRGERRRGKPAPRPSLLRRWVLGVAGCACVGGGDGEEAVSADDGECRDEVEDDNAVDVGGQELITNEAGKLFQRRGESEEAIAVRVKPGRWLDDEDEFLAPVMLQGDGNTGEFSTPILNPATTAASHEQQLLPLCHKWSSSLVTTTQDSAFTIVAGNTARGGGLHAAAAAGGENTAAPRRAPCTSLCDPSEDDAAPSELGCGYPPSEASVVWSVVTAEGAASCNFSSAASGYYYHHINSSEDDGAFRHDAGRRNRRRRSGMANTGGLMTCIGDKAVDAVGAAPVGARHGGRNGGRT